MDTKPSKLGTPYIEVTPAPAAEGEEVAAAAVQPKPRRLANLVTSWGPGVSKLKKLASGQGGAATATLPAKTRTSPRVPPSLPPKSDYVVQQQQSGESGYTTYYRYPQLRFRVFFSDFVMQTLYSS